MTKQEMIKLYSSIHKKRGLFYPDDAVRGEDFCSNFFLTTIESDYKGGDVQRAMKKAFYKEEANKKEYTFGFRSMIEEKEAVQWGDLYGEAPYDTHCKISALTKRLYHIPKSSSKHGRKTYLSVFRLYAKGLSQIKIAKELNLATGTVASILKKCIAAVNKKKVTLRVKDLPKNYKWEV